MSHVYFALASDLLSLFFLHLPPPTSSKVDRGEEPPFLIPTTSYHQRLKFSCVHQATCLSILE